jgi:hypothetical protein
VDLDSAYHFDADPDVDPDPTYHFDADADLIHILPFNLIMHCQIQIHNTASNPLFRRTISELFRF